MAFTEKKAPTQFQFTKIGTRLEGLLIGIQKVVVNGKPVTQYMLEKYNEGGRVTFLATADLAQKIERKDLGHPITVEFAGFRDDVVKNGNRMRNFEVRVDYSEGPGADHITDEDIPF